MRLSGIESTILSTAFRSYPIERSVSVISTFPGFLRGVCDGSSVISSILTLCLSSTIIFRAIFFPIQGRDERNFSSPSSMAFIRRCVQSESMARAVFPPTPLTFRSFRNSAFSSRVSNPKRTSETSVI